MPKCILPFLLSYEFQSAAPFNNPYKDVLLGKISGLINTWLFKLQPPITPWFHSTAPIIEKHSEQCSLLGVTGVDKWLLNMRKPLSQWRTPWERTILWVTKVKSVHCIQRICWIFSSAGDFVRLGHPGYLHVSAKAKINKHVLMWNK